MLAIACAALGSTGCKKKAPAGQEQSAADAGVGDAGLKLKPRCAVLDAKAAFTLGTPGRASEGDDDDLYEPFSVEIGAATPTANGYAIAALEPQKDGTHALLALVGADAASGTVLQLGRVHGNPAAPRADSERDTVVVAIADQDAAGGILRVVVIRQASAKPDVDWGFDVGEGWDESPGFDVAVNAGRGLLAWDRVQGGLRSVSVAAFTVASPDERDGDVREISAKGHWAESPRLIPRAGGGFWISWLERAEALVLPVLSDAGDVPALEVGLAHIMLRGLSADGAPSGDSIAVNQKAERIVAYDVARAPDGQAVVAWRQGLGAPGVPGGGIRVARAKLDGTVTVVPVDDPEESAGAPTVLSAVGATGEPWFALHASSDGTLLGRLRADALIEPLRGEPAIGAGEPLVRRAGSILLANPRGRAVELSVVSCQDAEEGANSAKP